MEEIDSARLEAALAIVRQAQARLLVLTEPDSAEAGESLSAMAERLYAERRKRDAYFPAGLFGEPAWDLLLALFVAHEEGRPLPLGEAYGAARVDSREGPRLIERLVAAGLIVRARGDSIVLTEHGSDRLSDYLADLL